MALKRYLLYGLRIESQIELSEARRAPPGDSNAVVELTDAPLGHDVDWFHRWRVATASSSRRRRTWLAFGRRADGYVLRFRGLADFHVSLEGDLIRCRPAPGLPLATLRHLLLDQVLPLAVNRSGRLVLHASAVHVPRFGVIAFAGGAATGKSTLAAALATRGCPLIADDALVVVFDRDTISAIPGYPGVRIWTASSRGLRLGRVATTHVAHYTRKRRVTSPSLPFRTAASPLRGIFLLASRGAAGRPSLMHTRGTGDRISALLQSTFLMDIQDRALLSRTFSDLVCLARSIPVLELRVRNSPRDPGRAAGEVLELARRAVDS